MRTIFSKLLLLPCLFALTSCKKKGLDFEVDDVIEHDYAEVADKEIKWDQLFLIEESQYLVYFYSPSCSHCREIKNQIIDYALDNDNFYFIKYSDEVVVSPEIKSTIGATSIDDVSILGTPSLIEILDGVLIYNLAGTKEILNFLNIPFPD